MAHQGRRSGRKGAREHSERDFTIAAVLSCCDCLQWRRGEGERGCGEDESERLLKRTWLSFCAPLTERAEKSRLRSESERKAYFEATVRRCIE